MILNQKSILQILEFMYSNTYIKTVYLLVGALLINACATFKPYVKPGYDESASAGSELTNSIFVVSGYDSDPVKSASMHRALRQQLSQAPESSTLLMLGNLGPRSGFPDSSHLERRNEYDRHIAPSLETIKSFAGKSLVIPGLNEWANGRKRGLSTVTDLQDHLTEVLDNEEILLPGDGCPGPVEVSLSDETVLLVINTQWWFQTGINEEESSCEIKDKGSFLVALSDAIKRNYQKQVIVAGFHPLYSNGPSSGFYPAGKYFLPPVIGTLHAWYKRRIGDPQDVSNPSYKIFRGVMRSLFKKHSNLIYLSGKEKSFQYFNKTDVHMIVTGSFSGATATTKGREAEYAYGKEGYTKINQYANGEVWLEFWGVNGESSELVHKRQLYKWTSPVIAEKDLSKFDFSGQTITAKATDKHDKPKKKRPGLSGLNYRKEWGADIEGVEVINLGTEKGGLTPIQRGGGMQTRSLRLQDPTGKQWVLRSVEKFPANALPPELRGTFADDLVTDQVSTSHPYGALVVPSMAEAVNVYHANPRLVYLPDDPRLGIYQQDFANAVYVFEERADDDKWGDDPSFGKPDEIVSTLKLVEKMKKDSDHRIDEPHAIRSRLFDIVLGDWDRHDDQWRWSRFKKEEKYGEKVSLYRPIPRDRDQAFFLGDGGLLKFGSHKWGQPKFQGFKSEIRDVKGLEFNARYFDRYFITESDWSTWEEQTTFIQENLTDQVIETAIKSWPKEIYELNGEKIIVKLKKRRDDLRLYAREFYEFQATIVTVLGTEKADKIVIERLSEDQTKVTLFRVSKKKREVKGKYYERTFNATETKEIRVYGLGGKDEIEVTGDFKGIKTRIIGGEGDDVFDVQSGKKTIIYDNVTGTQITNAGGASVRTSDNNEGINRYNRSEFKYNVAAPMFFGGFNPDDGILIGGGVSFTKHGFRKDPFKSKQTFLFDVAPKSSSFNFKYVAEYNHVIGKWDLTTNFDISEPSFADFFYGYGNGAELDADAREEDTQFYRARYSQIKFTPALRRRWNDDKHELSIGGLYHRINAETEDNDEEPGRFLFDYSAQRLAEDNFQVLDEGRDFAGGFLSYGFDNTNNSVVPTSGFRFDLSGRVLQQIGDEEELNSGQFASSLSAYFSIGKSDRVTIASRIGGVITSGDFEFYHAARLGGNSTLRGHRRLRFAGKQAAYWNNDIRIKLFDVRSRLILGPVGITLIADAGKVWADGLTGEIVGDDDIHGSVGGGIWVAPFKKLVIGFDYTKSLSLSDEDGVPFVRFGFFF